MTGSLQNLSYLDDGSQWEVSIPSSDDSTRHTCSSTDVPLQEFLSRPVIIANLSWTPGIPGFVSQINPWGSFLANKRVSNRMNNYNLITADICIKFIINGNGFYYGRLMADYKFLQSMDVFIDNGTDVNLITEASQRLKLFIDPCTSQGGVMKIPFMSFRNTLNIPIGDWSASNGQGGLLTIREINPLKHANAAVTPIDLTVMAWMENVKLSVPTTSNAYGLTAQAGDVEPEVPNDIKTGPQSPVNTGEISVECCNCYRKGKKREKEISFEPQAGDEYGSGAVSRVASATQSAAKLMSYIPSIAPMAMATSTVAGAIGSMAKQVGLSRPAILDDVKAVKPQYIGNVTNSDCGDNVTKLTFDSKQEVTIDPGVLGPACTDDLMIAKIAGKESFLTTVPWTVSAVTDATLFSARVSPITYNNVLNTYYLPACTFAALPFMYWRGCMRYRFQIVASQFHKGRIRVIWDPNYNPATPESNINYTRIVDISSERDIVFDVKWGKSTSYLVVDDLTSTNHSTTRISGSSDNLRVHNGTIGIQVLNTLTTPNSTANNDISINVFISMVDAEFAVPNVSSIAQMTDSYTLTPQAGDVIDTIEEQNNTPEEPPLTDTLGTCIVSDHIDRVYFGETISSFRSLLKRYTFYRADRCPNTTTAATWKLSSPNFPAPRGYGAAAYDTTSTGMKYNFVNWSLFQYLTPAFLGMRGSIRWKAILCGSDMKEASGIMSAVRGTGGSPLAPASCFSQSTIVADTTTTAKLASSFTKNNASSYYGAVITPPTQQPVLEFELPFYSMYRAVSCRDVSGTTSEYWSKNNHSHSYYITTDGSGLKYLMRYFSIGEDFNFIMFQGCPPMGVLSAEPLPS